MNRIFQPEGGAKDSPAHRGMRPGFRLPAWFLAVEVAGVPPRRGWAGIRIAWKVILLLGLAASASIWAAEGASSAVATTAPTRPLSHSRRLRQRLIKPDPAAPPFERPRNWVFVPGSPEESIIHNKPACGGDLNGDGFADVLLGQPRFDHGRGRVLVFYGSRQGLGEKPDAVIRGEAGAHSFGELIELPGDLDGDGFDDSLVFGRNAGSAPDSPLQGFVLRGSPDGLVSRRDWALNGPALGVGDLNGDGFDDLAGRSPTPDASNGTYSILFFRGSPNGPVPEPAWTLVGDQAGTEFGHAMAAAGDVNGDGIQDLIVGAYNYSGRFKRGGRVFLYHGSALGPSRIPDWTAEYPLTPIKDVDEAYEQFFGHSVSAAGDVNGDGFGDVIVAANFADRGDVNEGLVFVYHGSAAGLGQKPVWWAESNQPHALFGQRVATVGDVNDDGFDDVIVGAPSAEDGQLQEGAVVAYHGSRKGLQARPAGIMESDHSNESFGTIVACAGDVNGDGYPDALIFGPNYHHRFGRDPIRVGRVVVAHGGPPGLPFRHEWRMERPFLLAVQHELDIHRRRHGAVVYWGPGLALLAALGGAAFTVQVRLRRRLAEALAENRQLVAAQERARLARDVHDHLGAQLTQIALWTDIARTDDALPPSVARNLERVAQSARSAVSDISQLVWAMNPANDTFEQFAAYLGDQVVEFLKPTAIAPVLDFGEARPEVRLSMEARSQLFAVTKEVLNNVVRHARATRVTVRLEVKGGWLHLHLEDNGVGFDAAPPGRGDRTGGGNGLGNMFSRIRGIGGDCRLESRPGAGTRVSISLDLEKAGAAADGPPRK